MQKRHFEDANILAGVALAAVLIINIVFYRSGVVTNTTFALALWWLMLPGFVLVRYWREKMSIPERVIIGSISGLAVSGLAMYYLGLLGLRVQVSSFLVPLLLVVALVLAQRAFSSRKTRKAPPEHR